MIIYYLHLQYHTKATKIKIVSVDGMVGAGKTTLLRHLACGTSKKFHPIIGIYYTNYRRNYLLIEEPIHLYQRNGLLKLCLEEPETHEDVFQMSASHIMHVHLLNVIELAIKLNINTIIMERHLVTVYRTFGAGTIEKYPTIEMNLSTSHQIAVEDLTSRFQNVLYKGQILHGCIYVDWADHSQLVKNIVLRGREMEINKLKNDESYSVNKWLEKKYKHMLEIINVPIFYISEKFGDGNNMMDLVKDIHNYLENI